MDNKNHSVYDSFENHCYEGLEHNTVERTKETRTEGPDNPHYVRKSTMYKLMGVQVVAFAIIFAGSLNLIYSIAENKCQGQPIQIDSIRGQQIQPSSGDTGSSRTTTKALEEGTVKTTTTSTTKKIPMTNTKLDTKTSVTTTQTTTTTATTTSTVAAPTRPWKWITTTNGPVCPSSWPYQHGSSCYRFVLKAVDWTSAKSACRSYGGYLVEIKDTEEQNFLASTASTISVKNNRFWIGLTDFAREGTFVWDHSNETLTSGSYRNWNVTQPDNFQGIEDCAHLNANTFSWNDRPCYDTYYSICEKDG